MNARPVHLVEVDPFRLGWRRESFFDHAGRLHRAEGPAVIAHDAEGGVREESYFLHGTCARIGGPAKITYPRRESGLPRTGRLSEEWVWNGCTSRLDGPAVLAHLVSTTMQGKQRTSIESRWFLEAHELLEGRSELVAATSEWTDERLLDELGRTRYASILDEVADPRVSVAAIAAGVDTVEGMLAVLHGAPVEWVVAFEDGEARESSAAVTAWAAR